MSRPRSISGLLVAMMLTVVIATGTHRPALVSAQPPTDPVPSTTPTPAPTPGTDVADDDLASTVRIEVESVSPWVEADGTWTARLRVPGAPTDARIAYSIRQPATGTEAEIRSTLVRRFDGEDEPKVMQRTIDTAISELDDGTGVVELAVPIRRGRSGDRARVLIPNSGVYPVVVTVEAADGTDLASTTLYLNCAPVGTTDPTPPFRLGILARPSMPLGFDDAGRPDVTPALRNAAAWVADLLDDGASLPIAVDLAADGIEALSRSEVPADVELLARLRTALRSATVFRDPWADLHLENWSTTGGLADIQYSLVDSQVALFTHLERPIDSTLWPPDPTVGPAAVEQLTRLGLTSMVVEPGRLNETRPPAGESGFTRPFRLTGDSGTSLPAMSLDPEMQQLIELPTDDPALAAHQLLTLAFGAFAADGQSRGAILQIDETAEDDVVAQLLTTLARLPGPTEDPRVLEVVDPNDVTTLPTTTVRQAGRDTEWTRDLSVPDDVSDVATLSERLALTRRLVDDYSSILADDDATAAADTVIVRRSLDRRVPLDSAVASLDALAERIRADFARITASKPRSVSLTSREATIPLRFTNGMDRPIQVVLRLKSPRIDFVDGKEQLLTLTPGLNRIDVEVQVQTSGQIPMQAELVVPDSDRVIASTRQRIQANTFSGVGLMLSGGALLFLVVWWSRTLRRRPKEPVAEPDPTAAPH